MTTTTPYRRPKPSASSEPTHIRDVLVPIAEELAARLDRRAGARAAVLWALRMHEARAEGFDDCEPIQLVAEFAELAQYEEPQP